MRRLTPLILFLLTVGGTHCFDVTPSLDWKVATVDTSDKNSASSDFESEDADGMGYIHYTSTASTKGVHLSQAINSIRLENASDAKAIQQAFASSQAFTEQSTYTNVLKPYLKFFGGKMLTDPKPLNVYLIFYGTWSDKQKNIIKSFVLSLGSKNKLQKTPSVRGWWSITSKYYFNAQRKRASSNVVLAGTINDKYSQKPHGISALNPLTFKSIRSIVARAVSPKKTVHLPMDENGAYFVLTSKDVYVQEFCLSVCAFHTSAKFVGKRKLAYAFVGDPTDQCATQCSYKYFDLMFVPPNGDLGADAIVDRMAHELTGMATNALHGPRDRPGWIVAGKQFQGFTQSSVIENADLCEWEYGQVNFERSGVVWNMVGINNMKFLVQLNYNRLKQTCTLQG